MRKLEYERKFAVPRSIIQGAVVFIALCFCYLGWTILNVDNYRIVLDGKDINTWREYDERTGRILSNLELSETERAVELLTMVNTYRKQRFLPRDGIPSKGETQLAVRLRDPAICDKVGPGAKEFMLYMDSSYSSQTRMDKYLGWINGRPSPSPTTNHLKR